MLTSIPLHSPDFYAGNPHPAYRELRDTSPVTWNDVTNFWGQTIPGIEDELFNRIEVPTLIIRGGEGDLDHPRRTSLKVSCLIKNSTVIDPPWPEDYWERAIQEYFAGDPGSYNMFTSWPLAAPAIRDYFS